MKINILTRTSNRPIGFNNVCNSIRKQTYKNINHIVCTDDLKSIEYIKKENIKKIIIIDKNKLDNDNNSINKKKNLYKAVHNLYFNEMIKEVNEGWILYLDDDNHLLHKNVIEELVNKIKENDEDTIIFFRILFKNKKCLPVTMKDGPKECRIDTACFIFHSKYKKYAIWDQWSRSDYRVISKLYKIIPKNIFIPKCYIFINQQGLGNRKDIELK